MTEQSEIAVLDRTACLDLLREHEVGRLAVTVAGQPDIFPVNYTVDGEAVVFCTAEGTKLAATSISSSVAFETDGYDPASGDAWSVVLKGRVSEIPMYERLEETAFALFPWSATVKSRFLRIELDEVTGRRFHVVRRRPGG